MISPRLRAALGTNAPLAREEEGVAVRVDDVDRRYRDAIKSGATPLAPPAETGGIRSGVVLDGSGNGIRVRMWSAPEGISG